MISTAVAITHTRHMFLYKGHIIKWKLDKAEHPAELTSILLRCLLLFLSTQLKPFHTFQRRTKVFWVYWQTNDKVVCRFEHSLRVSSQAPVITVVWSLSTSHLYKVSLRYCLTSMLHCHYKEMNYYIDYWSKDFWKNVLLISYRLIN